MATQPYKQTTTIQPSPAVPDTASTEEAKGWRTLAATFDHYGAQAAHELQQDALLKAEQDAPQIIKYQDGVPVAPSSFDPEGGGMYYRRRFRAVALDTYKMAATQDFRGHVEKATAQFPTNPALVTEHLTKVRDAALDKLEPSARPALIPHYNAMIGQAAASADVARTRMNLKDTADTTVREINAFTIEFPKAGMAIDKLATADPATLTENQRYYQDWWKRIENGLRNGAGATDQVIASQRERIGVLAQSRAIAEGHWNTITSLAGQDQGTIASATGKALREAREHARRFGKYEPEVYQMLSSNIGQASTYNQQMGVQAQEDRDKFTSGQIRKFLQVQSENADGSPQSAANIEAARKQIWNDVIANNSLRDSDRLRVMSQVSGFRNPIVAEAYRSAAVQLIDQTTAPGIPDKQREEARNQVERIARDPAAMSALGGAGVASLNQAVATYDTTRIYAKNVGPTLAAAERGEISPQSWQIIGQSWRDLGIVTPTGASGSMSEMQFAQAMAHGSAKYKEISGEKEKVVGALNRFRTRGDKRLLDDKEVELADKHGYLYKPKEPGPDGKVKEVDYDETKPDHLLGALGELDNGIVHPALKDQFARLGPQSSVKQREAATSAYAYFEKWYRKTYPGAYDGAKGYQMIENAFDKLIGGYDKVKRIHQNTADASPADYANPPKGSDGSTRANQGGESKEAVRAKLEASLNGSVSLSAARFDTGFMNAAAAYTMDFLNLVGADNITAHVAELHARSGNRNYANPGTWTMDPETKDIFLNIAEKRLAEHGKIDTADGRDPIHAANLYAYEQMKADLGFTYGPDGSAMLSFKPLEAVTSKMFNTQVSAKTATDFWVSQAKPNMPYDKDNVTYSRRFEGGRTVYDLISRDKPHMIQMDFGEVPARVDDTSNSIVIATIDPTDPQYQPGVVRFKEQIVRDLNLPGARLTVNRLFGHAMDPMLIRENAEELAGIMSGRTLHSPEFVSFVARAGRFYASMFGHGEDNVFTKISEPELATRLARFGFWDWVNPVSGFAVQKYAPQGAQYGPRMPPDINQRTVDAANQVTAQNAPAEPDPVSAVIGPPTGPYPIDLGHARGFAYVPGEIPITQPGGDVWPARLTGGNVMPQMEGDTSGYAPQEARTHPGYDPSRKGPPSAGPKTVRPNVDDLPPNEAEQIRHRIEQKGKR